MEKVSKEKMWRRLLGLCSAIAVVLAVLAWLNPINSGTDRLVLLACVGCVWLGFLLLSWRHKWLKLVMLGLPVLAALLLALPGRKINAAELRTDYVKRMTSLERTEYVWGGENFLGIDCSGLPRKALRDALLAYGLKHLNGRALRASMEQWWHDASAKALSEGYRSYALPIENGGKIREMDFSNLLPGDLAITSNGVHVLAYVGGGKWIQADPGIGAVATLDGHTDDNGWFDVGVRCFRWRLLEE